MLQVGGLSLLGLNLPELLAASEGPSRKARHMACIFLWLDGGPSHFETFDPGVGERDVWLYDRVQKKLLPTPGLNAKQDDFDPVVIANGRP